MYGGKGREERREEIEGPIGGRMIGEERDDDGGTGDSVVISSHVIVSSL